MIKFEPIRSTVETIDFDRIAPRKESNSLFCDAHDQKRKRNQRGELVCEICEQIMRELSGGRR